MSSAMPLPLPLAVVCITKRPMDTEFFIHAFHEKVLENTNYAVDLPFSRLNVDGVKFRHPVLENGGNPEQHELPGEFGCK